MARAEALMGGTRANDLRRDIKGLSAEFGIAKNELVNGLYNALSAGVPKDNVIDFLRTASKAAIADNSDVAVSVDGITTVLNAFKLEAAEATRIADVMFKTVALGKTNFQELSSTIAVVAPLAQASGVAFEQVFAAVATLTKQGTPTAQAMTQIRAALLSMNDTLGDGWSKTMTFQEGLQAMSDKAGGSATRLKAFNGQDRRRMLAVLATTGENAQGAASDLNALADAVGILDKSISGSTESAQGFL